MSTVFQRENLVRLPLPLAQLYSRAFNAKEARGRHDNAFYLYEATIKLAAIGAIAAYRSDIQEGAPRTEPLNRLLTELALPSLGQWLVMLRELARHFDQRPDATSHPWGRLWDQLSARRQDLPAILALYRRIKDGPDGRPSFDAQCSLVELFEALVRYRNIVFGHGAGRDDAFYEQEMGPLLFPALNELFAEGVFDLIGSPGSRLIYLTELRVVNADQVQVGQRDLVGMTSERAAPLELSVGEASRLVPNCVAILSPGRRAPVRLDPLLVFRETELMEEVLFLQRDRNGRQAEYLSYSTGRTERDQSMGPALTKLLSQIAGREISIGELQRISERNVAESLSVQEPIEPQQPASDQILGEYELLAEIGRGGQGVVYLAKQISLGRLVTLKLLPADLFGDEVALARFSREIHALSQCDHPHVVRVITSGKLPDGRPFYAMEYVPGADLEIVWRELGGPNRHGEASELDDYAWARAVLAGSFKQRQALVSRPARVNDVETAAPTTLEPLLPALPDTAGSGAAGSYVRQVATIIRDAALALQSVHDRGIVHRDVKPSNFVVTPDGSRVVLMDFGLAKGNATATLSRTGGFIGTLRYAAPEQLAAASVKIGPPADVRGLGVTFWELLTRERLFSDADDEKQLASSILSSDVPRLRVIDPTLDADLEAIVARATERRAADRIQTAAQLAAYLDLYLEGKPLPIRVPSAVQMLGRWVRSNAALVGMAVLAALLLVGYVPAYFLGRMSARAEFAAPRTERQSGTWIVFLAGSLTTAGILAIGAAVALGWARRGSVVTGRAWDGLGARLKIRRNNQAMRDTKRLDRETKNDAFSSQTVVIHYPSPIALAYQRFCQASNPNQRVEALFFAVEMTIRYLVILGVSDLLQCMAQLNAENASAPLLSDHDFTFLREPTPMTLGMWRSALSKTADLLARHKKHRYVKEFPAVLQSKGHVNATLLGKLLSERNCKIHDEHCIPADDFECRAIVEEAQPVLVQILLAIRFIRKYPLAVVQRMPGRDDASSTQTRLFHILNCQGTQVGRRSFDIESTVALQEKFPFVVSSGKARFLYLWPLLMLDTGQKSTQMTLFAFTKIADNSGLFLAANDYAAIDQRDAMRRNVLKQEPALDHGWLLGKLADLAKAQDRQPDLKIAERLLSTAGSGQLAGKTLGPRELGGVIVPGTTVELGRVIGQGGFGKIYEGWTDDGKHVAVKVLEWDTELQRPEELDTQCLRFQQEIFRLEKARHPGIIQIYDSSYEVPKGLTQAYHWYSMEFAVGDLSVRIADRNDRLGSAKRVPWNDAALRPEISRDFHAITDAVAHLHGLDIIHRDIKPGNVLIMNDGTLRLSDFGLVKHLKPTLTSRNRWHETGRGDPQGTPDYWSPEQSEGKAELTKSADVFSLGILLAELAIGKIPTFASEDKDRTNIKDDSAESESQHGSLLSRRNIHLLKLPEQLRNFIYRCTDRVPNQRPADARSVQCEFAKVLEALK